MTDVLIGALAGFVLTLCYAVTRVSRAVVEYLDTKRRFLR